MTMLAIEPSVDASFKTVEVDGLNIFYREPGEETAPKLVLLHGFPSSSHQYRNLIPALAKQFHVIAPDYPGFGKSDLPDPAAFRYSTSSPRSSNHCFGGSASPTSASSCKTTEAFWNDISMS